MKNTRNFNREQGVITLFDHYELKRARANKPRSFYTNIFTYNFSSTQSP